MVVEAGATAGVFPSDETRRWLESQDRGADFARCAGPLPRTTTSSVIDLSALVPVAPPASPGNGALVAEAAGTPRAVRAGRR